METSNARSRFNILFTSDCCQLRTDDAGLRDGLASQLRSTRPSNCAPASTSSTSQKSSNLVQNNVSPAKSTCQHGMGGATNRNHFVNAGIAIPEEESSNTDEIPSRESGHAPFLSVLSPEMRTSSINGIGREVLEVAVAAAAAAAAKASVTCETANSTNRLMQAGKSCASQDVARAMGNDLSGSLTPPLTFEEIITFADLCDESTESLSQRSFAGFIEDGVFAQESPRSNVHTDDEFPATPRMVVG